MILSPACLHIALKNSPLLFLMITPPMPIALVSTKVGASSMLIFTQILLRYLPSPTELPSSKFIAACVVPNTETSILLHTHVLRRFHILQHISANKTYWSFVPLLTYLLKWSRVWLPWDGLNPVGHACWIPYFPWY